MDATPTAWMAPPYLAAPRVAGMPERSTIPDARYREVILAARRTLAARLERRKGYRVEIVDVTARDFDGEVRRIDRALGVHIGELRELGSGTGAYSAAFPVGKGLACIAAGYPPGADVGEMLSAVAAGPVERNGLDDATFHRITLWHETGHCILGRSEAEADAFAFLVLLQTSDVEAGALSTWAAWREVAELSSPVTFDDHMTSRTLWAILGRAGGLRADPHFKALGIEGLAALAKAFVARHGLDEAGRAHVHRVRYAVAAGAGLVASLYPERGPPNLATLAKWLDGVSGVPEFTRLRDLRKALAGGAVPIPPSAFDPVAFEAFLKARQGREDPVAEAMLRALSERGDVRVPANPFDNGYGAAMAARIPYRPAPGAYETATAALDPSCETVPPSGAVAETSSLGMASVAAFAVSAR